MATAKHLSPSPTELIDWLNAEGVLELDWDFPDDGDLFAAGLNSNTVLQTMVTAIEDKYGVVFADDDLTRVNLATPATLANLIAAKSKASSAS